MRRTGHGARRAVAGYSHYYRRLETIRSPRADECSLQLALDDFGGSSSVTIRLPSNVIARADAGAAILELSGLPPGLGIDAGDVVVDPPSMLDFRRAAHSLVVARATVADGPAAAVGAVSFQSINLQIPLAERAPANRVTVGLALTWSIPSPPPFRVELHRPPDTTTCFTKGNFALAFPAQAASGAKRTSIFYPPRSGAVHLRYGYIRDPSPSVLRTAGVMMLVGAAYLAAYVLYHVLNGSSLDSPSKAIASLAAVAVPLFAAFTDLASPDRHSLYARRLDYTYLAVLTTLGSLCLTELAIVLAVLHRPYNVLRLDLVHLEIQDVLLPQAIVFFAAGIALILLLRAGVLMKYECDNHFCTNRIYIRNRVPDCYPSGRVVCRRCYDKVCMNCNSDFQRFGGVALTRSDSFDDDPTTNQCQPLSHPDRQDWLSA